MNIITLPLGPLETNCYLVCEDGVCAVIDPGASAQKIFAGMQAAGCRPAAICSSPRHRLTPTLSPASAASVASTVAWTCRVPSR